MGYKHVLKGKDFELHVTEESFLFLSEKCQKSLELRFSLNGNERQTYKKIGAQLENNFRKGFPVSAERVRQLVTKGIRILRNPRWNNKMIWHDN